ncbi:TetR/AcrR family transcriptional regulator [Mesobacillus jeotgali]|uniref:TetR/AcrR family transcriptional regulator n=1 Tax=Mesobacillus jeotgali TaxID=129985 RepID=UPI00177D8AA1|nr:helix-turn-helix domain-containing protein [Mesobacillus jeotgali]UYZ22991.1 TetR/AcrR family transcriptional regulator [Mesobacillus jeotgali]
MRDKTEQILNAAMKVFVKKGLQATTQEIAKEAEVAEVTLFRKFTNKQNLFVTVIRNVLERQFDSQINRMAKTEDTEAFLIKIIENRLGTLSKNAPMVKMLLSESLMGNLDEEVDLPNMIFSSLEKGLALHFENKGQVVEAGLVARHLGGIFVSQVVFKNDRPFHLLSEEEKTSLSRKYAQSVMAIIK